uniref:Domain of Kin17 curved DNA-binding protein, putative n=1 Tax=Theileria annulata TaxID=5874 RepID=A0A3B0N004_THEAN
MPRAEVGTHKWLANKMKSKGLQKLKWYCQMCEKQCRDENGFKCHRLSEGHQRMMQVFCQNSGRFMDGFSRTFENEFMKLMRTRYCKTKILANSVYQELISDKQHVHMNATIWVTLSEFVLYLGRSGKCKVEHTPKGWYIEYIDQEKLKREEDERAKMKREITLEQMHQRLIQKLVDEARESGAFDREEEYTPLMKDPDQKIIINTNITTTNTEEPNKGVNVFKQFYRKNKSLNEKQEPATSKTEGSKRKSELESIMESNKRFKESHYDKPLNKNGTTQETWLCNDILVKIILKTHEMYKQKFKVVKVSNNTATLDTGNGTLQIQDKYLETVLPGVNGRVKVLSGRNRGLVGTLVSADPDSLKAKVSVQGNLMELTYDDISQYLPLQIIVVFVYPLPKCLKLADLVKVSKVLI